MKSLADQAAALLLASEDSDSPELDAFCAEFGTEEGEETFFQDGSKLYAVHGIVVTRPDGTTSTFDGEF